jgi:hypothetical protein
MSVTHVNGTNMGAIRKDFSQCDTNLGKIYFFGLFYGFVRLLAVCCSAFLAHSFDLSSGLLRELPQKTARFSEELPKNFRIKHDLIASLYGRGLTNS